MGVLDQPSQSVALGISLFTASLSFMRNLFVLNKYTFPPTRLHILAYLHALLAGLSFWVTVNSVNEIIVLQLTAGLTASVLTWTVYVLLVNERLMFPTGQQCVSLLFYVVGQVSISIQVRLVLKQ